jgi:hypothetical protein
MAYMLIGHAATSAFDFGLYREWKLHVASFALQCVSAVVPAGHLGGPTPATPQAAAAALSLGCQAKEPSLPAEPATYGQTHANNKVGVVGPQ